MNRKRFSMAGIAVATALFATSLASAPALAGENGASCGGASVVYGSSNSSSATTYSGFTVCGTLQVSATYGTKCGVRSAWTYAPAYVSQSLSKVCKGWHKAAPTAVFTS